MTCVAITRGGHGELWLFDTRTAAYLHPLVQYGDALAQGPDDLVLQYNRLEWGALRHLAGLEADPVRQLSGREDREWRSAQAPKVWEALVRRASRPPLDPQQICDMVSRDRRIGSAMAKKKDDAPAAEAKTAANPAGNLPPAVKGPKNVAQDAVITMGKDKEGRHYGPDNNPKKIGSKTHGRFAMYRHGMTVSEALEAGITTADLVYDRDHGFVHFEGGKTAEPAAAAAAEDPGNGDAEAEQEAA